MRPKNNLKGEIVEIRKQLDELKARESQISSVVTEKETSEKMSSNLLQLFKLMMDEQKTTRELIKSVSEKLSRVEEEIAVSYEEEYAPQEQQVKEVPVSELDGKILQFIQIHGLTSAEDVRIHMKYKGKNAACARLNKLYRQHLIKRYQLGHKVYYKYDAGKTTKSTLIVSPPQ
ncbi:MAG: hypothetical protein M1504_01695 [Candidatus Marsarchaeota archaeon]|nr:hypothetical protein [Candidatus Marsarchaeota archaeon]